MSAVTSRTAAARAAQDRAREVGRRVGAGHVDLVAVLVALDDGHRELRQASARVPIHRLLRYIPGVGHGTVRLICSAAGVDSGMRLGDLWREHREALAAELRRWDTASPYGGAGQRRRT